MKVRVQPSSLSGTLYSPASKSSMQRACAAALLHHGETILSNPGKSNDDLAGIEVIRQLSAVVQSKNGQLIIRSQGVLQSDAHIHCGESGLGIRMFTPLAALSQGRVLITGEGSLLKRPMDFFDQVLPQLGVAVQSSGGRLPLEIRGPLQPKNIEIDGSLSSQFLTGLLMAYSAAGARNVSLKVKDLKSRPYVDLTLAVMKAFGLKSPVNRDYKEFYFDDMDTVPSGIPVNYTVEGDWSGGAFLLVAGALAGNISVKGLDLSSTQADRAVLKALSAAGCDMVPGRDEIVIGNKRPLCAFDFDATDCPDLFPPLVALSACCPGTTRISGAHRLLHKESNRSASLRQEFGKLGVEIKVDGDDMFITGVPELNAAVVSSHHDHRIAMACAVAGLRCNGEMIIEDAEAVDKSYPGFYDDIRKAGALVSLL